MLPGARATAALLSSAALVLVSAGPGSAAEPVAQATATGLVLTVAARTVLANGLAVLGVSAPERM